MHGHIFHYSLWIYCSVHKRKHTHTLTKKLLRRRKLCKARGNRWRIVSSAAAQRPGWKGQPWEGPMQLGQTGIALGCRSGPTLEYSMLKSAWGVSENPQDGCVHGGSSLESIWPWKQTVPRHQIFSFACYKSEDRCDWLLVLKGEVGSLCLLWLYESVGAHVAPRG